MRHVVAPASEIPPGTRKVIHPGRGPGIGVFNVSGTFYALRNICPHMGAPLCEGLLTGTTEARAAPDGSLVVDWVRDGEIIACPWHHWEFDITTGHTVFPSRNRVASYPVTVEPEAPAGRGRVEAYPVAVEDGLVVVDLGRRR